MHGIIISLCDLTGVMVMPWVRAGYRAILVDPQHKDGANDYLVCECGHDFPAALGHYGCPNCEGEHQALPGLVTKVGHELDHPTSWRIVREAISSGTVAFVAGFPVCTQLAVSGTSRWAEKRTKDANFQVRALELVHECRIIGQLSGAPWFFENPVSAISSMYRKPDHTFHPYEYGEYLPAGDEHPLYPEYFPPQDAYGKKTCLWTGGGFVMPQKRPVPLESSQTDGQGQSKAHNKLGGKSDKTKNIRSATPRGFAQAVFEANAPHLRVSADLDHAIRSVGDMGDLFGEVAAA